MAQKYTLKKPVFCLDNGEYLNVRVTNNQVILSKPFQYDKKMGKRAVKFFDASENITRLLQERSDKLYLNLRVEL